MRNVDKMPAPKQMNCLIYKKIVTYIDIKLPPELYITYKIKRYVYAQKILEFAVWPVPIPGSESGVTEFGIG
jgi:hypothetical protein